MTAIASLARRCTHAVFSQNPQHIVRRATCEVSTGDPSRKRVAHSTWSLIRSPPKEYMTEQRHGFLATRSLRITFTTQLAPEQRPELPIPS
jgi:hypothetical protein